LAAGSWLDVGFGSLGILYAVLRCSLAAAADPPFEPAAETPAVAAAPLLLAPALSVALFAPAALALTVPEFPAPPLPVSLAAGLSGVLLACVWSLAGPLLGSPAVRTVRLVLLAAVAAASSPARSVSRKV
jgi:hypothetical protein